MTTAALELDGPETPQPASLVKGLADREEGSPKRPLEGVVGCKVRTRRTVTFELRGAVVGGEEGPRRLSDLGGCRGILGLWGRRMKGRGSRRV